jgi:hypothetical protein
MESMPLATTWHMVRSQIWIMVIELCINKFKVKPISILLMEDKDRYLLSYYNKTSKQSGRGVIKLEIMWIDKHLMALREQIKAPVKDLAQPEETTTTLNLLVSNHELQRLLLDQIKLWDFPPKIQNNQNLKMLYYKIYKLPKLGPAVLLPTFLKLSMDQTHLYTSKELVISETTLTCHNRWETKSQPQF